MVRLTRVQQQARTRASVLAAARQEFIEQGYVLANVDRIAERAELTRGAVYSNFPSKRALYLAVLVEMVDKTETAEPAGPPGSPAEALGTFARTWLERLPLVDDTASGGRLQLRSLAGIVEDQQGRTLLAQVAQLEALLLAMGLETCSSHRQVRLAELVLTLLGGAGFLAEMAPGFGDPFDRARACEHLAGLDLNDTWAPPHLSFVTPAVPCQDAWIPLAGLPDLITGERVDLGADGVVAVLGTHRVSAAEEAVRAAGPGERVTVVVVPGDLAETGALVRLRISDLAGCLRRVFPSDAWARLRVVVDDGTVAAAAGLTEAGHETEAAVRVRDGMIVARAGGRGAAHAAADHPKSRKATT
ncbi:TetR/AcrR family transcriptional regulator [Nonomuraea sp. NPDC059007]|uniref:TetR/AcrR family transcriptional regulator n=1 Tax=Nonomuraea sp. NPDC059007 TaxID=3346692 RepID=UPI0036862FFA